MRTKFGALLIGVAVVAACDDTSGPAESGGTVRVVNATSAPLEAVVAGRAATVGAATVSEPIAIGEGAQRVQLRAGTATSEVTVSAPPGLAAVAVALPAAGGLSARALEDTGGVVPAGKSKLRVAHLAPNAPPVEIWRTQPDFPAPVPIVANEPHPYQLVSPYLQSDAGSWEVFVTPAGSTTRLVSTGALAIPAGQRRTVVLLDSAGVLRLRVIAE
ncbi:MAG TPA: DUF4397 domain-containing protein [Gemmatimonadaceae bacterium]|nr:DUF4397 domain-containing protein [Gemmatimonadaceae bacterium]